MIKGTQKVIYLDNDIIEEIQKREGSFSRNVNDLIRKGLRFEYEGRNMTLKEIIEELNRAYARWEEKKKNRVKAKEELSTVDATY